MSDLLPSFTSVRGLMLLSDMIYDTACCGGFLGQAQNILTRGAHTRLHMQKDVQRLQLGYDILSGSLAFPAFLPFFLSCCYTHKHTHTQHSTLFTFSFLRPPAFSNVSFCCANLCVCARSSNKHYVIVCTRRQFTFRCIKCMSNATGDSQTYK